ncbi:hypothetical protein SAMN04487967_2019 [Natronorubrum sediminis]|uniref:Uncharacterized protein n=1 Tax=Natronorubrum sediminis TaxID=640943 RepID=A0A1H6FWY4_9EURY|nr:hypothetical protein [Natronorubrum sediminis]SEH15321.1 hypothetical protein SAMN04487967_2019 [Natronorubrum sediminis]
MANESSPRSSIESGAQDDPPLALPQNQAKQAQPQSQPVDHSFQEEESTETVELPLSYEALWTLGRVVGTMLLVGVGIGMSSLLTWFWIESAILPEQSGTEAQIVEGYTPLVFLIAAALAAPIVASIVGLFEGRKLSTWSGVVLVSVGCFVGAVLLVFAAGMFVGLSGAGGNGGPSPLDLVTLAGLSGLASVIVGTLITIPDAA